MGAGRSLAQPDIGERFPNRLTCDSLREWPATTFFTAA
jgi:hypothetical protein